ncbi:MAG TPA: 50S ribosomal protein L11 methyltransferase [Steroidobacteraceae bacterium]|nr:50S ribosomal protein L11 methyltransferase [Steroidobacteraceae bacterium]
MPFLQLTLPIGSADPEPFEEALLEAGAVSITLEDAGDDPVLEPAPGTTPLWPTVTIKALFEASEDRDALTSRLRQSALKWPPPQFEVIEDRAWEREWLKDFKPMRFGQRLWICPDGQRPSSASEPTAYGPQPVFLDLDPGLAFGTGTHPTTRLCLEWLDSADLNNRDVIDYGCGSGILAIAALKLGAQSALAVDIDEQALTATVANAARNQVSDRIHVCPVNSMPRIPTNVLLANILAEPLLELADELSMLVVPDGWIVLSGLLESQADQVARRYHPWFDIAPTIVSDGWARLDGRRRTRPLN